MPDHPRPPANRQPPRTHGWLGFVDTLIDSLTASPAARPWAIGQPPSAHGTETSEDDLTSLGLHEVPVADTPPVLRPAVLLSLLRLCRSFGSPAHLARTIARPGSISLLSTAEPALDELVSKLLRHVFAELRTGLALPPTILVASAAVRESRSSHAPHLFAGLTEPMRCALERRAPVVLVAPVESTLDPSLRALEPQVHALVRPDRELVSALIMRAYPDRRIAAAGAVPFLPADAMLERLNGEHVTIALRAPDPAAAAQSLARRLAPPSPSQRLDRFPVPDEIRDAIDLMIADLWSWSAGRLPWRDVGRGALLVGPPGSGKTEIARLLAREAGVTLVAGSLARWSSASSRSGDVLREIRRFFVNAAAQAPCIAFLDELDAVGDRARPHDHNSAWTDFIVGGLLECLDGIDTAPGVLVLGATNRPHAIDAALRRPGRFDRVLRLTAPRPEAMVDAIRWHLDGDLSGEDLNSIASAAIGLSGADLAALVRSARARARTARRVLEVADLAAALHVIRPPLPAELRWRVALHEAGHAVVGHTTGCGTPRLLALAGQGGMMEQKIQGCVGDRRGIEAMLALALAGRAAEQMVLGGASAGAGGPEDSDLGQATRLAAALEISFGLGSSRIWLSDSQEVMRHLSHDRALRRRVEAHLQTAEARAVQILAHNRSRLEALARDLLARGFLSGPDLAEHLAAMSCPFGSGSRDERQPSWPPHCLA